MDYIDKDSEREKRVVNTIQSDELLSKIFELGAMRERRSLYHNGVLDGIVPAMVIRNIRVLAAEIDNILNENANP